MGITGRVQAVGREVNSSIFQEILRRQLDISENRAQETRAKCFTGMHGDRGYPPVRVPEEKVATPRPHNLKAEFFEPTYQFLAF